MYNIAVIGSGYVGLVTGALFCRIRQPCYLRRQRPNKDK